MALLESSLSLSRDAYALPMNNVALIISLVRGSLAEFTMELGFWPFDPAGSIIPASSNAS